MILPSGPLCSIKRTLLISIFLISAISVPNIKMIITCMRVQAVIFNAFICFMANFLNSRESYKFLKGVAVVVYSFAGDCWDKTRTFFGCRHTSKRWLPNRSHKEECHTIWQSAHYVWWLIFYDSFRKKSNG